MQLYFNVYLSVYQTKSVYRPFTNELAVHYYNIRKYNNINNIRIIVYVKRKRLYSTANVNLSFECDTEMMGLSVYILLYSNINIVI